VESYVGWVIHLARYHKRSPDLLNEEQVLDFLRTLHGRELATSTINQAVHSLRYFYHNLLNWPEECFEECLPAMRVPKHELRAYSVEQVTALLEAARSVLYQYTFLSLLYHTGLRLSEACNLQFNQIERSSRRIFVSQGKGKKDRYTVLPSRLQQELDHYYQSERRFQGKQVPWLFVSPHNPAVPLPPNSPQRFFHRIRCKAGLPHIGGIHILRHCFASHQLMCGMDVVQLKRLMGHNALQTTVRYMRLIEDNAGCEALISPLDRKDNATSRASSAAET
jgi:integrase/recombinase XerD